LSVWEVLGAVFGVASVVFTVKQHIWTWPTSILTVSFYAVTFFQSRLYADVGLQVVFFVLSIYGWYHWLHPGEKKAELPVTRIRPREALALTALGAAAVAALGTFLARKTNASFPYLDTTTTVMSLIAQWLLARKVLENWVLWIVADVLMIGIYWAKDLHLTSGLYVVYLALCVAGWRAWRREMPVLPA